MKVKSLDLGSIFVTSTSKTFEHDENLPNLPVPPLKQTLTRYLASVKPLASSEELKTTKALVLDFENGVGKRLQQLLLQKANHQKNWLEKWWLDYAYLTARTPLPGILNITSPMSLHNSIWPPEDGRKFEYAAKTLATTMEFWTLLREEKLKADISNRKQPMSMDQFRRLFSTTRLPGETIDSLLCLWKTASEGDVPRHIIVLCRGHVFTATPFNQDGEPITWQQWEKLLRKVEQTASSWTYGSGLGALTCDNRDRWFKNREIVRSLSARNQENLDLIESAMFAVSLDETRPKSESECIKYLLAGNPMNRWADKSFTVVCFASGWIGMTSDHTPFDAMCSVKCMYYTDLYMKTQPEKLERPEAPREPPSFSAVQFDTDSRILDAVKVAKGTGDAMHADIALEKRPFIHYGKSLIAPYKLHPDAYVQMAMQLAYYRMHGRPAPTYETATTREFYHARTETVRSCTEEAMQWVKSMDDETVKSTTKASLLKIAVDRHVTNMEECKRIQGCDRHLFGLYLTAVENLMPVHGLFTDPMWIKSGGGGNFILSSSLVGYTCVSGGTTAMCEDGYGVFYSIEDDRINISVSSWKRSKEADALKYWQHLEIALLDMKTILLKCRKMKSKL